MNNEPINPYYDPKEIGLEMLSFDEPGLDYEFNTLCFWATSDGQVFTASDSGCSCPIPFEDYSGATRSEVLQKLERVGSIEQAENTFDSWNKNYEGKPRLHQGDRNELTAWIRARLK